MPRAGRTCAHRWWDDDGQQQSCPEKATTGNRCAPHAAAYEATRGTRQQRGYDAAFDRQRLAWAPKVARGQATCWRCEGAIVPGESWHLGHDDVNGKAVVVGVEHADCNDSAAGRKAHGLAPLPGRPGQR